MVDPSAASTIVGALVEMGASHTEKFAALAPLVGGLAGFSVNTFFKQREAAAIDRMVEELRRGSIPANYVVPPDHAAAVLFRIQRAAIEGTANVNLRLMAQVIRGKIIQRDLVASEFLSLANILSDLRRPEIVLLGTVLRCEELSPEIKGDQAKTATALKEALVGKPYFSDEQNVEMYCVTVTRHGLLVEPPGDEKLAYGSFPVLPSIILRELATLVDIDAALKAEPPESDQ